MSYKGLRTTYSANEPHLGGSVRAGDPFTYCPSVWDYVVSRFGISSVLDLGSGCGNASDYFFRKGLRTIAVDAFTDSVLSSLHPAIKHDLTETPIVTRVDLVHCQEVVEHIEEEYLDNVLNSLVTGRIVLMTHAKPGQGGYHHVNLQPSEYWISHMIRMGCSYAEEDTGRIRRLAEQDGARYMASTGMIFINNART